MRESAGKDLRTAATHMLMQRKTHTESREKEELSKSVFKVISFENQRQVSSTCWLTPHTVTLSLEPHRVSSLVLAGGWALGAMPGCTEHWKTHKLADGSVSVCQKINTLILSVYRKWTEKRRLSSAKILEICANVGPKHGLWGLHFTSKSCVGFFIKRNF